MSYIRKQFGPSGEVEYEVGTLYQDGYERATFKGADAREEAIACYGNGAYLLGGMRGARSDIPDPEIDDRTVSPEITVSQSGGVTVLHEDFDTAIRLALRRRRLSPGSRYRVVVSFEKAGEPFVGEGI